jgi:hypothetical protein
MDIPVSATATAARARTLAILEKNILADVGCWGWFIIEDVVLLGKCRGEVFCRDVVIIVDDEMAKTILEGWTWSSI